ncbi:AraD1 family protein [Algoriphagus machipongonensis]|uniref:Sugar transporter n=1 Tax=Algoriphagus machipongonensis TaxID=388413 RepID=A3HSX2_9BACT|nr:AraD1 family protein [Algoriphagus machipongonensis]EAZ82940.1 sugar transporter [Algoriphagus machipongonensis]
MENKTRLVQLIHPSKGRRIALVQEPKLTLLSNFNSVYQLALEALDNKKKIKDLIQEHLTQESLEYDPVYQGNSEWKLLPSFDHPDSPFSCMVSGTGLTHHNSALNRQMMHGQTEEKPSDSLIMYEMGVKGGSPKPGETGTQPEWFYKGNGSVLKAHGDALEVPYYANDGGEEPEIAGLYIIDREGKPWRIGLTTANEFSDHVMEKVNYLYLAPSKIRTCSIGPEAVIDADFESYSGKVSVSRAKDEVWSSDINTGQKNMCHNLANLEFHHFKYESHRIPLQAHVHFYGADAFSFGNNVTLQKGDIMSVHWNNLGRSLENPIAILDPKKQSAPVINQL